MNIDASNRRLQYISASNTRYSITVTPLGGTTSGPYTGSCTPATCISNFSTTPGPNTIAVTLTDTGGTVLSKYSTLIIVQPSALNTIGFTANPVVHSASLTLASTSVTPGTASDTLVTINALDQDGNVIVGTSRYVDANGNPLTLSLTVMNSQAGGAGTITLKGPPAITAPLQSSVFLHYDGRWMNQATIGLNSSSLLGGGISGAILISTPSVAHEYTIPTSASSPNFMTLGSDGNLWFTEWAGNKIGRVTPGGSFVEFPIPSSTSQSAAITPGPDGNMWFAEQATSKIGRVTENGTITEFSVPGSGPVGIVTGTDGNLWFAEFSSGKIGRISPNGVIKEFATPTGGSSPAQIAAGPDGNLWFTENSVSKIGRITTSGAITEYTIPTASSLPYAITSGPDGNLWFVEDSGNKIGKITITGSFTEYAIPTASSNPFSLVTGTDGNLWFAESNANKISEFIL
jgi:virginiamycin B lyase